MGYSLFIYIYYSGQNNIFFFLKTKLVGTKLAVMAAIALWLIGQAHSILHL